MSLTCYCAECGIKTAYYGGHNNPSENDADKLFSVGRVVGDQGATYDDTKIPLVVYICEICLSKNLSVAYKKFIKREIMR